MNLSASNHPSVDPRSTQKSFSIWPSNAQMLRYPSGLEDILESSKNILISPWEPSSELKNTLDQCPYDQLPESDKIVEPAEIPLLSDSLESPLGKRILAELGPTISDFAALQPQQKIRVMLMRTLGRTCPLFHVDRVSLRMLCTLRGPGTEWLADHDVVRKGLGHGDNGKVLPSGRPIYSVPPYHICVLKGESFKGNSGRGIVHRSPSVPGNSKGRLYLRVDFE